ncbi:DnaB-like helicase N-terminal domain-containing protein [Streptomyces sp. NPDC006684]|uniref:DnaB-like helicase N-terminal domain-containing protein n=1 Tax=Streptomyces sp. NPDC006684 TaxID=3154477 RepID=UPI003456DE76
MHNVHNLRAPAADEDAHTRMPPQDLEAEQSVLGGMLLSRTAIDEVVRVLSSGADFYRPVHEFVYRAILDLHAKGEPADPITVGAELDRRGELSKIGGAPYLHVLVQAVPSAANAEYYAEIVRDHAVRRRIIDTSTRITQRGYDPATDLAALLDTTRTEVAALTDAAQSAARSPHLTGALLDWNPFFATDFGQVQLLPGKLMAPGQQITIVGDGKAGKSLLVQEWLWRMATGQSFLGDRPQAPVSVLYVDAENGHEDIQQRMLSYGAGPGRMGLLSYASFPPIRPLDTAGGGQDLLAMVAECEAQLVCLDTVSRFISGPENDADTWLSLYRHTLLPLKRAGIASVRLDHMGKDGERGARGSSAKTQDVDHVWELRAQGGGDLLLRRTHTRTGIGPEVFHIVRHAQKDGDRYLPGQTRHVVAAYEHLEQNIEGSVEWLIQKIDGMGLPADAGNPRTISALATAGIKASKEKIAAAVRARKNRAENSDNLGSRNGFPQTFPEGVPRERSPETFKEPQKPQVNHSPETSREPQETPTSPPSPPLKRGKGREPHGTPPADTPLCTVCHTPLHGHRRDRGYTTHIGCDPTTGSHPEPHDDNDAA